MKRLAAVVALLGMAAVSACSSSDNKPAATGGAAAAAAVYTTVDGNKPGIDPAGPANPFAPKGNSFSGYNAMKIAWVKNHLTDPNQFYPGIAESWEIATDNSSVTIKLQPNNKWSDGSPVTAEDVKLSIAIAYTQGNTAFTQVPGAAGAASEVTVVDDKTIKVTQDMANPVTTFARGVLDTPVVPAKLWSSVVGTDIWDKIKAARTDGADAEAARTHLTELGKKIIAHNPGQDLSAGPYVLERVNASAALLKKNPHFYNAANVAPEKVQLLNFTGNEQVWNYLIQGKLDSSPFVAVPADTMTKIKATAGNQVIKGYSPVVVGLAFNQSKAPYDNVHVRRGLAYLINREEVTQIASPEGGTAAVTTSGIHQKAAAEWLGAELGSLEPFATDVAKAEEEFKAAGLKKSGDKWTLADGKPWKVSMHAPAGFSDWVAAQENIKNQLIKAGVDAEVVTTADFPLYQTEMAEGQYDSGFWLIGLGPAPYNIFQRIYGSANGWANIGGKVTHNAPGKNGNWMGSKEEVEVEGLGKVNPGELTAKLNAVSPEEQKALMLQLAKTANADLPVIQLWDYVNTQFQNTTRFTGFPADDSDLLRLPHGVWIQLGLVKAKS
ncbi:ABC transporter substrate-binding protein [Nonomuraea sp. NPDC050663]|uniref:ABC transporter substrate-binding protein n=1 Tax=Nonomuraea sp. NPDC050663 TaxID=3364370 RepID=UPI0037ACAA7D